MKRRTLIAALAIWSVTAGASAQTYVTPVGMLDGTWQGELASAEGEGLSRARLSGVRLQVAGENVRVFMAQDGDYLEVKSGTFRIQRDGTNAVITSIEIDPGRPRNQGWVETWCFVVTLRDPNTLITNYTRVVNNNDLAPEEANARFSQIATGLLRRVGNDV
jgi:hypothetical protein